MKSHLSTRLFSTAALVGLGFAFYGTPAHAQQSELDTLRQQIAELQNRLNTLEEAQKKSADTAKTSPAATAKFPVAVSGLLQVQSLNYLDESNRTGGTRGIDTFRLRRGEIRLTAPSITDRISGTVMFDPAKTTTGRLAGGATTGTINIRARDNLLQEIQISYLLNKNNTNTSNNYIDVGQYKIPIGYESLVSSSALQNVERALIFTQRDPFSDSGYGDVRDTGIQLRGTSGQIDYRLGVFNGFGDRQNAPALSDAKAIMARIAFRPKNTGLELGVSGGYGRTGVDTTNTINRPQRTIYNAFAAYKKKKLTLISEFLEGDEQVVTDASGARQTRDIQGYYGHIGYLITPKLEATFRYDHLNTNRDVSDAEVTDYILGLNYYLRGNNAKIQTNLVRRQSSEETIAALRDNRTELRTNFQIAF